MPKECRVCGRLLRSESSRSEGAGPVCLRKERQRFGYGRKTPSKNQLSLDSKKDILNHYKNGLDQRVVKTQDGLLEKVLSEYLKKKLSEDIENQKQLEFYILKYFNLCQIL